MSYTVCWVVAYADPYAQGLARTETKTVQSWRAAQALRVKINTGKGARRDADGRKIRSFAAVIAH